ncbi:transducin-like enhancer protein 4 isoform X1 [Vespula squamosa]|uniref:Transducin-like enhancer protein 4 isoform X1 n=1 Tax=Vespula squamosa TaxID=30214 RepID=A0ABD2AB93_VESSQ
MLFPRALDKGPRWKKKRARSAGGSRRPFLFQGPPQPGQPFKFSVSESCDRIKEEFSFLQAQYHSIKLDLEKLAQEKTEMQRHYVMYYEMSYGLNVEMHKQVSSLKIRINIFSRVSITLPIAMHEHA